MAYHFSANQFEEGYRAKRLRNWEVPKWYPEHPRTPLKTTEFIANSRGHILPGVPKCNPWGNYKGTWDLPLRITKQVADEITAPPRKLQSLWSKRRAPSDIIKQTEESEPERLPAISSADRSSFQRRNKSSTALDLEKEEISQFEPVDPADEGKDGLYPMKIHSGILSEEIREIVEDNVTKERTPELPVHCRATSILQDGKEKLANLEEGKEKVEENMVTEKQSFPNANGPFMNDFSAFQIAKRFHDENLKHQPLPDVVDDPVFKALASNKDPFPGRALNIKANAAAIGWKSSGVPGPTKCSKVKVYRPKTGAPKAKHHPQDTRPKTCATYKDKRCLPIDLAICWDLSPEERPRRSHHIDGSHGGEAPSVFAVVRNEEKEIEVPGSAQAVAAHISSCVEENNVGTLPPKIGEKIKTPPKPVTNKGAIMAHVKAPVDSRASSFHSLSPESAEVARKNPKTAWSVHDTSKELSERLQELQNHGVGTETGKYDAAPITPLSLSRQKHHQSTPNLALKGQEKQCEGSNCGTESSVETKLKETKEVHKPPIKATRANNGTVESPPYIAKPVKIPKMRPPYAKKNYSISTLIPPFSLWPDHHGQEYPEHWRLASVYQHSYKPVDCRRKPLLASVYQ